MEGKNLSTILQNVIRFAKMYCHLKNANQHTAQKNLLSRSHPRFQLFCCKAKIQKGELYSSSILGTVTWHTVLPAARIKTYVRNMRSCKCRVPMRQIVKSSWFSAAFDVGSHQLLVVGHSGKPWNMEIKFCVIKFHCIKNLEMQKIMMQ